MIDFHGRTKSNCTTAKLSSEFIEPFHMKSVIFSDQLVEFRILALNED